MVQLSPGAPVKRLIPGKHGLDPLQSKLDFLLTVLEILGQLHRGALQVEPGRAIKYTTDEPSTGIAGPVTPATLKKRRLMVAPNPFNRASSIHWNLGHDAEVSLKVFNVRGELVRTLRNERMDAGTHDIVWDGTSDQGSQVASGVYFYRLETKDYHQVRKVFLVRIDSKLGRMMELEGFLSGEETVIRGTWLNYELAGGEGASGHWSARKRDSAP